MSALPAKELLVRAREGDEEALESLLTFYRASLRRWAHGRLPQWARDVADTEDLLQETLAQTLKQLPRIDFRDEEALQAYLRQAVLNRIRNELRGRRGIPAAENLTMPRRMHGRLRSNRSLAASG